MQILIHVNKISDQLPLKHKMLFKDDLKHAGEHDHQVLLKLVQF